MSRPKGDQGVAQAVGLITTNKESLMLSKYGLNALSELCTPPKVRYRENALEALDVDDGAIIQALAKLAEKLGTGNDEQAVALAKIIWAVFEGLDQFPNVDSQKKLTKAPADKLLASLAKYKKPPIEMLDYLVKAAERSSYYDVIETDEAVEIGTGILAVMEELELEASAQGQATLAICALGNRHEECLSHFGEHGAADKISDFLGNQNIKDKSSHANIEAALKCLEKVNGAYVKDNLETADKIPILESLQRLAESAGTLKKISELTSKCISSLFSDDEFFAALGDLANEEVEERRVQALQIAAALCYDSTYAHKIVDAGAVPSLLAALDASAGRLSSADESNRPKEAKALQATLGLLRQIAACGPELTAVVVDAGIMETLDSAMSQLGKYFTKYFGLYSPSDFAKDSDVATSICGVLSIVCAEEEVAQQANDKGLIGMVLTLISENCSSPNFGVGALEFVSAVSEFESLQQTLVDQSAFEICSAATQHHLDATKYQLAAFETMFNLCAYVEDLSEIASGGGFLGIGASLVNNCSDKSLIDKAFEVISYLAVVPGAPEYAACPELIDALCLAMYVNSENFALQTTGFEILEALCTADDISRTADELNSKIKGWKKKPDQALQAVSVAAILSQIPSLADAVASSDLITPITTNAATLLQVDKETFELKALQAVCTANEPVGHALFRAAVKAAGGVLSKCQGSTVDEHLPSLCDLLTNATLQKYTFEQPGREGPMLEVLKAVKQVLSVDKATAPPTFKKAAESLTKILNNFTEFRAITLPACEGVNSLLKSNSPAGADAFLAAGGAATLSTFCKRYQFQPRHLVCGMRNIRYQIINSTNPDAAAKAFKKEGALMILMQAIRAAGTNQEVQEESQKVIPLLMDEEEADAWAKRCIKGISDASTPAQRPKNLLVALRECSGAAASPLVAKALAKHGLGELATKVLNDFGGLEEDDVIGVKKEVVTILNLSGASPQAAQKLRSAGLFENTATILSEMLEYEDSQGIEQALGAGRRLFEGTPKDHDVAKMHNLVVNICSAVSSYPEDPAIVRNAASFLRSLAKSDETKSLLLDDEVKRLLGEAIEQLASTQRLEDKKGLLALIGGVLAAKDEEMASEMLEHDALLTACLEVLEADSTEGEAGVGALLILEGLGVSSTLRPRWNQVTKDAKLDALCEATIINIQLNSENPEDVATALEGFTALVASGKDAAAKKLLLNPGVNVICTKHESHPAVKRAMANLGKTLPPVGAELAEEIETCITAMEAHDNVAAAKSLGIIQTALRAPIELPDTHLVRMPDLLVLLNTQLASNPSELVAKNGALMGCKVMNTLAMKFRDDWDSPHGHSAVIESGCTESLLMISGKKHIFSSRGPSQKQACDAMALMAEDPNTRETYLEAHASMPVVVELLEEFENEPDVKTSIINLLSKIINGPPSPWLSKVLENKIWREKVLEILMGQSRAANDSNKIAGLLNTLTAMAELAGANLDGTAEGLALMEVHPAVMGVIGQGEPLSPDLDEPLTKHIGSLFKLADGRDAAYKELEAGSRQLPSMDSGSAFRGRYFVTMRDICLDGYGDDIAKFKLDATFAEILDQGDAREKVEIMEVLTLQMQASPESKAHVLEMIQSEELLDKIMTPAEEVPSIFSDPVALNAYLRMMNEALTDEEFKVSFVKRPDLLEVLAKIPVEAEMDDESPELLEVTYGLLSEVTDENGDVLEFMFSGGQVIQTTQMQQLQGAPPPDELTLKRLFEILSQRKTDGLEISPLKDENPELQEWFEYCWERMSLYAGYDTLTKSDFAGDEIKWGCLCWELWLEDDYELCGTVTEWQVHDAILISQIVLCQQSDAWKDVEVCTPASIALCAIGAQTHPGGKCLADVEGIQDHCNTNMRVALDDPRTSNKQDHLIVSSSIFHEDESAYLQPRIKVVEKAAVDRSVFPNPQIQKTLLECWDKYDAQIYNALALRQVFRSMRRALAPTHVDLMEKQQVCKRLVDELKKDYDNPLLVDGFFLLGILAGFPKLRTIIGQEQGVEESLTIIRNHMSDASSTGVLTNAISALGNIVLDHRVNDDKFVKLGGLKDAVWVLNNRVGNWSEINAAAALIANSSYKRDDIKAKYGSIDVGGPQALAYAISCYDGSLNENAFRALTALFKAIANLALYVPNIDPLIDGGLDQAYYSLLEQGDALPDRVIATSLLTLANLTAEYKPVHAAKFNIILQPLILCGQAESRQDATLIALILETFASLCRLPENSTEFGGLGGVEYVLSAVSVWGSSAVEVLRSGARAIGTIARSPENVEAMLANDVLTLLTSILNGEYYAEEASTVAQYEVAMACFRALRKLVAGYEDGPTFSDYLASGGLATWLWFVETLAGVEDPLSALVLELFTVFCGWASVMSPPVSNVELDSPLRWKFLAEPSTMAPQKKAEYSRKTFTDLSYQMGLTSDTACRIMVGCATIVDNECYKQNMRVINSGLFVITTIITQISQIPDMVEEVVTGSQANSFTIINTQKKLALIMDTVTSVNYNMLELICQAVANFAYNFGSEALASHFPTNGDLYVSMNKFSSKLEKVNKKALQDFLTLWKAGASGTSCEELFEPIVQYHLDNTRLTNWSSDTYPNGVQDLPFKDVLRRGGKCEYLNREKVREAIYWRSNQVLKHFQWKPVAEGGAKVDEKTTEKIKKFFGRTHEETETLDLGVIEFKSQAAIGRMRITKGLDTVALKELGRNPLTGVRADYCLCLLCSPSEESPQGDELSLIFSTKLERDNMYAMLFEWKTAATS